MMPADLIYALSSDRQRAALNRARAERVAAFERSRASAGDRSSAARTTWPVPTRHRWVRVHVRTRRIGECTP